MRTVVPKELQHLDAALARFGGHGLAEFEVIGAFFKASLCHGWGKRQGRKCAQGEG